LAYEKIGIFLSEDSVESVNPGLALGGWGSNIQYIAFNTVFILTNS